MKIIFVLLIFIPYYIIAHSTLSLQNAYKKKGTNYQPRTRHINDNKANFTNHLILANSPYLLQHAHNPVNWYSFSDEAFKLAKTQNKLIFLSIGYATCHWCHVMEEESFEDLEVAKTLNKNFISIKVDREVLPDVDNHFMNIAQLIIGGGGWPLNLVLTPDGDAFFAGTYFPKNKLIANLTMLQNVWLTDKKKISKLVKSIKHTMIEKQALSVRLPTNLQTLAVTNMLINFDEFYGGFGNAPKFPQEPQLLMLINEQMYHPDDEKLDAITTTLDSMASGGIYDVIGGGFHRYATDDAWLFPHFEKMLYNQAQLAMVYSKAYELTNKPLYKRIAMQTLDYVIREMRHKNGGFYSATDADSEGEEGLFFIWKPNDIKKVLNKKFDLFAHYFDLNESTEFEEHNVIHYENVSELKPSDFAKIDPLLSKLYSAREKREKPLLDNKILLSWNALLLKSFVIASEIDDKYLSIAKSLSDFLLSDFYKNTLKRVQINGQTSQKAIFEDYAYLADALIALFDKTNDKKYIKTAKKLIDESIQKFWDNKNFGFKISNNKRINTNTKEIYDGAIFSSNGIAYGVLNKLSSRLKDEKYQKFARQLLSSFSKKIANYPNAYASIVKNHKAKKQGALEKIAYAYDGKIKIQVQEKKLTLDIAKGWHINANKVLQKGLITTKVSSNNLKTIHYPKGKLINLGFSKEQLAVYDGKTVINFSLIQNKFTLGTLTIQACSDTVCLAPETLSLPLKGTSKNSE